MFDLDGTLVDSAPDLGAAVDSMRLSRGLASLGLASYRPMAGAGARGMLQLAFNIDPEHVDFLSMREEFFCNYERNLTHHTRVFEGVPELIQALVERALPWGVVTNKSQRFTTPLTNAIPLFASAGVIISGDTTAHSKPHPLPLQEAARRLGVAADQCLYIGDDERDICAGRAAGMLTVAATYGYLGEKSDVACWRADFVVNAPIDVLQLIDSP